MQKSLLTEIFGVFECLLTQHPTNQDSLDSTRPYERQIENSKPLVSRELFLPENNFKTCSAANSRKWLKN